MSQDNGLLVFRRFSRLSIQSLVHMQTEIAELEHRVREQSDSAGTTPWGSPRDQLMDTLSEKLEKYREFSADITIFMLWFRANCRADKALLLQSQLRKLKRPEDEFMQILSDWAADSQLLNEADGAFLADQPDLRRDLVSLDSGAERKVWAYRVVERLVWRLLVKVKHLYS